MAPTDPWRQMYMFTICHTATALPHAAVTPCYTQFTHLDSLWDLVDVLRFDDGPQVVLQDFGEIVLQLRTSEVGQDFLPVWRILEEKPVRKHKQQQKPEEHASDI